MSRRRLPLWTLLGLALVGSLVVGSGALSTAPPTAAERASAIESVIRCPSCEDLSVATSSAPTAVAVRDTVRRQVAEGRTDRAIEDFLVSRYGSAIVLDPPARGWSLLVWLLPLLGGAVAVGGLAVVLLRRRSMVGAPSGDLPADDAAALEERRRFLLRSLADADAEFLAGDLSDRDYLALRQRDLGRLTALGEITGRSGASRASGPAAASAVATIDEDRSPGGPAPREGAAVARDVTGGEPRPPRSRGGTWLLRGAVAAFASALVVAVALFVTARQPGQTATGSVPVTETQKIEQTLAQAATDENQGQLGAAAQLYQSVLDAHPEDEVALAQLGWLEYRVGTAGSSASLLADARAKLDRAVQLDPGDYAARLYLGTVLFTEDHDAAGAVAQYRSFLADGPPAAVVHQAAPELRQAYQQAGVALPVGIG